MEHAVRDLHHAYPGHARGIVDFDERMAHALVAAADYCVVPSRFEPCGLVAKIALQYGAVPIVTSVGGLRDQVAPDVGYLVDVDVGGSGVGGERGGLSRLEGEARAVARLARTMRQAVGEYGGEAFMRRRARAMAKDGGWGVPAAQWEAALLGVTLLETKAERG